MAKKNTKNTKQDYATEEVFQDLDQFAKRTENFFERNAQKFAIGFGIVILGVVMYFLYLQYIQKPKMLEANKKLVAIQRDFAQDSLDKVLGNEVSGAAYLANEERNLPAGKMAALFAGNVEFRKGNFQKALEYFKKYESKDDITTALAQVAIGDCYVELNDNEQAMKAYKKALGETKNGGTQLIAVKKATILAVETQQEAEGLKLLEKFKKEHPDTDNSGFVDAYIARLEAANGK